MERGVGGWARAGSQPDPTHCTSCGKADCTDTGQVSGQQRCRVDDARWLGVEGDGTGILRWWHRYLASGAAVLLVCGLLWSSPFYVRFGAKLLTTKTSSQEVGAVWGGVSGEKTDGHETGRVL